MSNTGAGTLSAAWTPSFRRRTLGRAASPPTWACYEQIPYDDDDDDYSDSASEDESCSEDEEDYARVAHEHDASDGHTVETDEECHHDTGNADVKTSGVDEEKSAAEFKADVKGKQRAVEPEPEIPRRRHHKKQRRPVYTLRPILTIQKSQGFVWNQVCVSTGRYALISLSIIAPSPGSVCPSIHQRSLFVSFRHISLFIFSSDLYAIYVSYYLCFVPCF